MNDKEHKAEAEPKSEKKGEAEKTGVVTLETQKPAQEPKEATQAPAVEEVKEEIKETLSEPAKEPPLSESKKEVKVSDKLAEIIKEIERLTVVELADLVKALEDKFGVCASAPPAAAVPSGVAPTESSETKPEETQTTFNVILADSGANKISVIKAVRELVPTLGLKEAKDLVDSPPKPVLQGVNKDTAAEAKSKLEAAGAKVELQ